MQRGIFLPETFDLQLPRYGYGYGCASFNLLAATSYLLLQIKN